MSFSNLDLCAAALVKLGAVAITSFDDPCPEAEVSRRLYPIARDMLLSSHPWAFTLSQAQLAPAAAAPLGDFDFCFELPPDLVRTISAGADGRGQGIVYRIAGGRLQTDSQTVLLTYQCRPNEADFPPHFVAALVARLAAEFCLPLTENGNRAEVLYRLASAEAQLARLLDRQQSTPAAFTDFSLIDARSM